MLTNEGLLASNRDFTHPANSSSPVGAEAASATGGLMDTEEEICGAAFTGSGVGCEFSRPQPAFTSVETRINAQRRSRTRARYQEFLKAQIVVRSEDKRSKRR